MTMEVYWVFVTRRGGILRTEPVVETMLVWSWFFHAWYRQTHMPLAEVNRVVTVTLQYFRDGDFALEKMHPVLVVAYHMVHTGAYMVPAGKRRCSRGRADSTTGMKVRETNAACSKTIERRSLHGTTVTTDVFPTEIVDVQHDDVRTTIVREGVCRDGNPKA
jgi:hypothetical protein